MGNGKSVGLRCIRSVLGTPVAADQVNDSLSRVADCGCDAVPARSPSRA